MDLSAHHRRVLLDVARQAIRAALGRPAVVATTPVVAPGDASASAPVLNAVVDDDPVLRQPAGCFVTLHAAETHRLRGCVGRLDTDQPLIKAVRNVSGGVLRDPRFLDDPVRGDELNELELEITIVFPLEPTENCLDFEPQTDGIYLTVNDRAGCFLPQVAQETGWTREQLLARLCTEKLGLPANAWQQHPAARLMKFKTMLVGPEAF